MRAALVAKCVLAFVSHLPSFPACQSLPTALPACLPAGLLPVHSALCLAAGVLALPVGLPAHTTRCHGCCLFLCVRCGLPPVSWQCHTLLMKCRP